MNDPTPVAFTTDEIRRRVTTGAPGSALSRSAEARAEANHRFDLWLDGILARHADTLQAEVAALRAGHSIPPKITPPTNLFTPEPCEDCGEANFHRPHCPQTGNPDA